MTDELEDVFESLPANWIAQVAGKGTHQLSQRGRDGVQLQILSTLRRIEDQLAGIREDR